MNEQELNQLDQLLTQARSIVQASLDRKQTEPEHVFLREIILLQKRLLKLRPEREQAY